MQYFSQLKVPIDKANINYTKHTFYKINFMKTLLISFISNCKFGFSYSLSFM